MAVLAVDPGNIHSGWILWDQETATILDMCRKPKGKELNVDVLNIISRICDSDVPVRAAGIERIAIYSRPGMGGGGGGVMHTVTDTCIWIGRFVERLSFYRVPVILPFRKTIMSYLCQSAKGGDAEVKAALVELYGGKGTKKNPGRLYGIAGDTWSALAVAVTVAGYMVHDELALLESDTTDRS